MNKKMFTISKDKEVIMIFVIPVVLMVIIVLLAYLPSLLANPQTGFVYSVCPEYKCDSSFTVDPEGRIQESEIPTTYYRGERQLYEYDVDTDSAKLVTVDQVAADYTLSTSNVSPDGYKLTYKQPSYSGGFLWRNYSDGVWVLEKSFMKKEINLAGVGNVYYAEAEFVGWIE
jgi:hypothetical protein